MFICVGATAKTLSNKAVFYRCYKSITQQFPDQNHTLISQVVAGSKTPEDACMEVLEKAMFTASSNKKIANTNDPEAIAALRTMHYLHYSWLTNKEIPNVSPVIVSHWKSFLDPSMPSMHFTKALFTPNYQFKNVFLGSTHMEPMRADNDPAVSSNMEEVKSDYPRIETPFSFVARGDLHGVREYVTKAVNYSELAGGQRRDSRFNWDFHKGGGVLGSNMYMVMNINDPFLQQTDGTLYIQRKWSLNLIHDFLCREAPVVRYEDTTPFIVNNSPTEFRRDGACIRCHVTLDRTASLIRGVHYKSRLMGIDSGEIQRLAELNEYDVTQGAINGWSDVADPEFFRRPSTGHFMYRTFDGQLINQSLTSVEELGSTIANLEDPYVCVAKRYYEYFTGVSANIDDIGDPQYGRTLNDDEVAHRNEVINLGKAFKTHQSSKQLIKDIISKPQYKETNIKIPSN